MRFIGYHGTCAEAANRIIAEGFKNVNKRARAGPGAYFWAGEGALELRAVELSRTWAAQMLHAGAYDSFRDKRTVVIKAEFEIEVSEYLDVDQRFSHFALVALQEKSTALGSPFKDEASLYAAYIKLQQVEYLKKGTELKVVKAFMPAPARFSWDFTPYLTKNVVAYIVQPNALGLVGPDALTIVN